MHKTLRWLPTAIQTRSMPYLAHSRGIYYPYTTLPLFIPQIWYHPSRSWAFESFALDSLSHVTAIPSTGSLPTRRLSRHPERYQVPLRMLSSNWDSLVSTTCQGGICSCLPISTTAHLLYTSGDNETTKPHVPIVQIQ